MQKSHLISNNPPSEIELISDTTAELGRWLQEHPVIQNERDAKEGKLLVDRASNGIKDLEAERRKKVDPLNAEVKAINTQYAQPRERLTGIKDILLQRLTDFAREEQRKREEEAQAKRRALEEAEARARAAEEATRTAAQDAAVGVTTDILNAGNREREAMLEYDRALRVSARAERDTQVKLSGGYKRALSFRSKETLTVINGLVAIDEMGISEALTEAILKEARAYRKRTGHLPVGVVSTTEEVLS